MHKDYHIVLYILCIFCFMNGLGTLPDNEENVTRTACVRKFDDETCVRTYEIQIMNCVNGSEEYNVYNLVTPVASEKYCFGKVDSLFMLYVHLALWSCMYMLVFPLNDLVLMPSTF